MTTTPDPDRPEIPEKFAPLVSKLIAIWLDGFASGAASAARTLHPATDEAAAVIFAQTLAHELRADPLNRAVVEREVFERISGVDSGPVTLGGGSIVNPFTEGG